MTVKEAYEHQLLRLSSEQKIQVNVKEQNIGRKLLPVEIVEIFNLAPEERRFPVKKRLSDDIDERSWSD